MSNIDDINSVLAIISGSGSKELPDTSSPRKSQNQIIQRIHKQFTIKYFFIRQHLFLLKLTDPYDLLYENYWELVFDENVR
jgi:hypothetical protein